MPISFAVKSEAERALTYSVVAEFLRLYLPSEFEKIVCTLSLKGNG